MIHAVVQTADIQDRDGGILALSTMFGPYPFDGTKAMQFQWLAFGRTLTGQRIIPAPGTAAPASPAGVA